MVQRRHGMRIGTGRVRRGETQRGFTLIEVLVGIVLTGILILGMTGLWATVGKEFMALTLRQQAVYRLNAEMARLAGYARTNDLGAITEATEDTSCAGGVDEVTNLLNTGQGQTWVFTSTQNFGVEDVFEYDDGAGDSNGRNLVWLRVDGDADDNDVPESGIVAAVSWKTTAIANTATTQSYPCSDGSGGVRACYELTVCLKYPYRFSGGDTVGGTGTLSAMTEDGFVVQDLLLKTVVGSF